MEFILIDIMSYWSFGGYPVLTAFYCSGNEFDKYTG